MKANKIFLSVGFSAALLLLVTQRAPSAIAQQSNCYACLLGRCQNYGPLAGTLYKTCLSFGSWCALDDPCDETLADAHLTPAGAIVAPVMQQDVTADGALELRNCSGALVIVRKLSADLDRELESLASIVI